MNWRDQLPIHPAAELFPLMSEPELRELAENIKANGYLREEPVTLYEGKLLDGRNRLDALESIGVNLDDIAQQKGITHNLDPSIDPYTYVISKNIHRRHLTAEQRRDLIAKLVKAKPEASNLQIAKQMKADDKTVARVRSELEARSEIPNVGTRTDTKGRKQPSRKSPSKVPPKRPYKRPPDDGLEVSRVSRSWDWPTKRQASEWSTDEFMNNASQLLSTLEMLLEEMAEGEPARARQCVEKIAAQLNAAINKAILDAAHDDQPAVPQ
jgi:hypothetical protein